jgi:hypothetical protein
MIDERTLQVVDFLFIQEKSGFVADSSFRNARKRLVLASDEYHLLEDVTERGQ